MALARSSASTAASTLGMTMRSTAALRQVVRSCPSSSSAGPSSTPYGAWQAPAIRAFSSTPASQGKSRPGEGNRARRAVKRAARVALQAASRGEDALEPRVSKKEQQRLPFDEAIKLFQAIEVARPLNAFELHVVTNVSKNQANALRGRVALPKETRKRQEIILIFAEDDSDARRGIERMRDANASLKENIIVGGPELIQDIVQGRGQASKADFTKVLSTDSLLPQVSRALARSLGPRGLMPSVKRGTVARTAEDMENAIRDAQGAIDWRGDRNGVVRTAVGRINFSPDELKTNVAALLHVILDKINSGLVTSATQSIAQPAGRTGEMTVANQKRAASIIKQVHLSSTQGPGVLLTLRDLL